MTATSSAVQKEVDKFAAMAETWWDPQGPFKPLHKFNPTRIAYIRDRLAAHFGRDVAAPRPFDGLTLLDIGCGGGLLSEPLARLGFTVTAIDATEKNIHIAEAHAARSGVAVDYRHATPEDLTAEGRAFDAVVSMEVIEHVEDHDLFLSAAAAAMKDDGLMVLATLNRTLKSLALAKLGAEYVMRWLPPGTHDWQMFVKPSELGEAARKAGLRLTELKGMSYNPLFDTWAINDDLSMNYVGTAVKAARQET